MSALCGACCHVNWCEGTVSCTHATFCFTPRYRQATIRIEPNLISLCLPLPWTFKFLPCRTTVVCIANAII